LHSRIFDEQTVCRSALVPPAANGVPQDFVLLQAAETMLSLLSRDANLGKRCRSIKPL
jgi:hypothetical protein